jgi:hypothetical protein
LKKKICKNSTKLQKTRRTTNERTLREASPREARASHYDKYFAQIVEMAFRVCEAVSVFFIKIIILFYFILANLLNLGDFLFPENEGINNF